MEPSKDDCSQKNQDTHTIHRYGYIAYRILSFEHTFINCPEDSEAHQRRYHPTCHPAEVYACHLYH